MSQEGEAKKPTTEQPELDDQMGAAPTAGGAWGRARGGGKSRGGASEGRGGGRGKSRGGGGEGRGRGANDRGGATGPSKQNRDSNENYAVVGAGGSAKCYLCGEEGHLATLCPKGQADVSNAKVTPVEGGGKIVDVEGDLMTAPDSLCHCVSQCLAMGKGVAVLFKQKFGGVDELKAQKVVVPGVATLHRPTEADSNKYVYYLITKPRYFDKPTYDTLAASLEAMFAHMEAHGVKSVSMPEIGCGLDGLQWPKVHEMLIALSQGRGITVTVYHFKPAKQMWSKKGKYA